MTRRALRAATLVAVALIVLSLPMAFGGVRPWATDIFRIVIFAAAAATAFWTPRMRWLRAAVLPALAVVAIAGLGALQSLAWPAVVVERVSPEHLALARTVDPGAQAQRCRWRPRGAARPH